MKQGFTLIELLIVLATIGILIAIAWPVMMGTPSPPRSSRQAQETKCLYGYVVVIGRDGSTTQLIGEGGGGVRCTN